MQTGLEGTLKKMIGPAPPSLPGSTPRVVPFYQPGWGYDPTGLLSAPSSWALGHLLYIPSSSLLLVSWAPLRQDQMFPLLQEDIHSLDQWPEPLQSLVCTLAT